jgi:hypothetical protein
MNDTNIRNGFPAREDTPSDILGRWPVVRQCIPFPSGMPPPSKENCRQGHDALHCKRSEAVGGSTAYTWTCFNQTANSMLTRWTLIQLVETRNFPLPWKLNRLSMFLFVLCEWWSYLCDRPWRPIGLWDVETPTFSRQLSRRWRWGFQPHTSDISLPQEDSLYSFLLRGWVDPRVMVRVEGSGQLKHPITSSGIGPVTFRLAA